jgi:hypothetical protein
MPIPGFTIDGVLPPYVGSGPADNATISPYIVTAQEVVATFGSSEWRRKILRGWLRHRAAIRTLGFDQGFQWLDGSFVEDKDPRDLDVVSFVYHPTGMDFMQVAATMRSHQNEFSPACAKLEYHLDAYFVELDATPETIVRLTRYWSGLFSHRRGDFLWKGMVQIGLDDVGDDAAALAVLGPEPGTLAAN